MQNNWTFSDSLKLTIDGIEFAKTIMPLTLYNKFDIEKVIFNDKATIVIWKDNSKTIVKCGNGDVYDKEKGLSMAFMKKALGNKSNFNNVLHKHCRE